MNARFHSWTGLFVSRLVSLHCWQKQMFPPHICNDGKEKKLFQDDIDMRNAALRFLSSIRPSDNLFVMAILPQQGPKASNS